MDSKTILSIQRVTLSLGGKRILNDLTLDIWRGHVHAVIGPNGAGKSTLASTIMGLNGYREYSGDIYFESESLKDLTIDERARRGIGLAWQEPARYEGLTVETFISAGMSQTSGLGVDEALLAVGLDPDTYRQRAVDTTLSGGERKRIELASILSMKPRLVIMDEPDSGIDIDALNKIFEAIKTLRKLDSTVVLITHSLAVLRQADHAFLICCGRVVRKGSVSKIETYFGEKCIPCDHKNDPAEETENGSS